MARTATPPRSTAGSREAAFDVWFSKHVDELRAYCTRLTGDPSVAEEAVQETFARAWVHIETLSEREEVGPWLYRVARNLCVDSHRARSRLVSADLLPERSAEDITDRPEAVDPVRHVMREEERELVREAMAALTPRHRDVLYLRDIEGLAYEELGRRHGLSGASARAVLARARRRLRDELKTMGQGVFGAAVILRSRFDDLLRRAGGDRAGLEPLTAAVAQYVVAAAAVVGMAAGPALGEPPAPRHVGPVPAATATSASGWEPVASMGATIDRVVSAAGAGGQDGGPAEEDPLWQERRLTIAPGPGQGLPDNPNPSSDDPNFAYMHVLVDPDAEWNSTDAAADVARQGCGATSTNCGGVPDEIRHSDNRVREVAS